MFGFLSIPGKASNKRLVDTIQHSECFGDLLFLEVCGSGVPTWFCPVRAMIIVSHLSSPHKAKSILIEYSACLFWSDAAAWHDFRKKKEKTLIVP
ncbi:hypothetical protein VN97_g8685 [Penicillium thymicola]|uniref:Uncharacterized protein n=1 Tax=Penicillium thymicola TaxID=293382 RepID=A0AAI9TCL3_PENTH|nr:hypothetical protein VN97_g8685 [Penicillium thymicola]